ncbi:activator of Hsp90 ATPase-like protein [Paenibacillus cellulosilyticus]|uniref:Activator of Hsp90 ATPase-like protein n=1 Tax=Paenibacillus cellulosilyticus TaxID=375489 RepID=A0A2V2YLL7_9BACL|nr:SRPBCC domain-containing protein [Paenibacillus cellulosilyticus]PWV94466.1 activator of Hsp90 ATPase-like protein [Paenibacillus cellulosilyticus]QKS44985.1 SRPBCC domain-containing protein [Paenibacillus cellulosilyticus]
MQAKVVGQTKSTGFQVGVRRTFNIAVEDAWDLITSTQGIELWLGHAAVIFEKGHQYQSSEGITGEIRTVNVHENIRLTWKRESWAKPSTVQVRTIAKGKDQTTISFHQENLGSLEVREEMKVYWEEVLNKLKAMTT